MTPPLASTGSSVPHAPSQGTIALPSSVLSHLRRSLQKEVGDLSTTHILQDAGFATGESLFASFAGTLDVDPAELGEARFWRELNRHLGARGWGQVEAERIHPGVGVLHASHWAEAAEDGKDGQPGCHFSSGLLAHILSQAAGGPIAVLEIQCRSRGDTQCSFLYGSEGAIHELYGLLLDGASLDEALDQL
jgi:predicted hydrocarbon binding protein